MSPDAEVMLTLRNVRFGFAARPDFLGPLTMSIERGACWAIVGPNGAGKSTLLRLMAGLHQPHSGAVEFRGTRLDAMSSRNRARRIAFVPQQVPLDLDFRVQDVVLLGRFPHRSLGLFESVEDHLIAERAMEVTGTLALVDRPVANLSGGEAQRVHVAAALAQQTEVLLLDEPTASLDLKHQLGIFRILQARTATDGLAVVVVTHDVNLAAQFCTHVLVLDDGRPAAQGPPAEVLIPEVLEPIYEVELTNLGTPGEPNRQWIVPVHSANEERR